MSPLLEIAISAAHEAGAEIMRHYASTDFETKDDGSPVTIADTRSNDVLMEHLQKTGIPILSEESSGVTLPYRDSTPFAETAQGLETVSQTVSPYPDRMWIIDPLDGTRDFLRKNGFFSVMIGLLENGVPTLGVVYGPDLKTLYYAETGMGAFMVQGGITKKLTMSDRKIENLRFIRSVNHFTDEMQTIAEKLNATLIPRGSIGLKVGFLGENEGDFSISRGRLGEWDVCAPQIIATEAGGMVSDCNGNPLTYGTHDHRIDHGVLFSNGACHTQVLTAIRSTIKKA